MTILFQGWPHDGDAERPCSKDCRTCNLTAEVKAVIDYHVAAERERCAKIAEKVGMRVGNGIAHLIRGT